MKNTIFLEIGRYEVGKISGYFPIRTHFSKYILCYGKEIVPGVIGPH